MKVLMILCFAVILSLGAPVIASAGDFDDSMGYDDGFNSPNEDLKMNKNISYVKQKAMAQVQRALEDAEEQEQEEDLEQQQEIEQAVQDALAKQQANQQGNNGFTLDDVQ